MQGLTLVGIAVPNRHHVRVADGVVHRQLQHAEFHGVERIDPPWSPARTRVHPDKLLLLLHERFPGLRDDDVAIQYSLNKRKFMVVIDLLKEAICVEPWIARAGIEEAQ